jgi:hypothetical protein
MKLKKITIVDVDIEPNRRIYGNEKSIVFAWYDDGHERDNEFELTWDEVYEMCKECVEAERDLRRTEAGGR